MDEADRVIQIFPAKREPGVPGFNRFFHVSLEIVFEIEINDLATRRHDIAHDAVAKIEHVEHELAAKSRNVFRLLTLLKDKPKLFFTVRKLGGFDRLKPKHF